MASLGEVLGRLISDFDALDKRAKDLAHSQRLAGASPAQAGLYSLQKQAQEASIQQQKLAASFNSLTAVTAGAAASVAAMAAVASPVAFSTLTDSVELLVMHIGAAFIPAMLNAALYVQHFTDWIASLGPWFNTTVEWLGVLAVTLGVFAAALAAASVAMVVYAALATIATGGLAALFGAAGIVALLAGGVAAKIISGPDHKEGHKGLLTHYPKEMEPRFSAVEDARKHFQLKAFLDPIDQEKLKLERDNNKALAEINQNIKDIKGKPNGMG